MAVDDVLKWDDLLRLRVWTPMPFNGAGDLSENLKKLAPSMYAFVVDSDLEGNEEEAPYITMVIWAESDGAALRMADGAIEADVQEVRGAVPPAVLLPAGHAPGYRSILEGLRRRGEDVLETAEYRIASDGAFLHKVIRGNRTSYYFRSNEILENERPFAIAYRLS